ncbi:putative universal stress (ethanol tolerance) protein B [Vibrio chagasii]|jgi:universal stress protein B|uniref:universal stress protein UspB n=1 Tax=Vibrio TaxID=662 RepID=UPI000769D8B9|nr:MULTISPECIES: universal stress protein UspB [Vibrio]MDE9383010.1 universal stress protein UspB [Vibrio alginolyticus]MCG9554252.1 universal stress protein UspB [Vibrio sp. Isolate32]MCG9563407.1 universal stress protein UspB [Vibrio chagasii]MCG9600640.1 universal stress protein UspB [Vibrio sp. Isolate31]MCG9606995.1 universal stress protein UspB [Vibrio chagasii]
MISGDTILFALMVVTCVNWARYFTALRTLIYIMREAHPLLYQQVDGGGFFTTHGNMTKQVRLFSYIKSKEYHHHHDEVFTSKCDRVRQLFILSSALLGVTLLSAFIV